MADVDGKWNCTVMSPMGEQDFVLTVNSNGDSFSEKFLHWRGTGV